MLPASTDTTRSHGSSMIEKVMEYRFLADLTAILARRGTEFDIMRSDVDMHGHDIVIEVEAIIRHIQLKATIAGGRRTTINVNCKLERKAAGCVVWMTYDPETLQLTGLRWFGGLPTEPLPPTGSRVARHSRANAAGHKALRGGHRLLSGGRFEPVADMEGLASRLFGTT